MNYEHRVATIVSRVFDPFITLTVLLIVALGKSTFTTVEQIRWFVVGTISMIGVPLGLFIWMLHTKKITNWDVSNRQERPKLFLFVLVYEFIVLFFLRSLLDDFVYQMLVAILVSFAGFSAVTLFWKISGHAFVNALVTGFIIVWFGWGWWPVLLIVPLVSWARVVRGDHSALQVILGALYGWISVIAVSIL